MGSIIRVCAIVASAIVALSFVFFAVDQATTGSEDQVRAVEGQSGPRAMPADLARPAPDRASERIREADHSSVREAVDDADDVLVGPFTGLVDSDDAWVQRIVPALIGLLLYGGLGLLLANWIPEPKRETRDWRTAG